MSSLASEIRKNVVIISSTFVKILPPAPKISKMPLALKIIKMLSPISKIKKIMPLC